MTEWTHDQQDLAQAEGWDIFDASGSQLNENGDRPFQLRALDDSDKFDGNVGWRDHLAWAHVYNKAMAGSLLHQQALNFLREHSTPEFEAIVTECSEEGPELNEEYQWPML